MKVNAVNVRFEYWIIQIFEKLTTGLYKAYLYYNYWFICSHVIYVFYSLLLLVLISKSPNSFEFIYFSLCVNRFINLCSVFCPVWFTVLKCEYDAVIHVGCTLFSSFWLNSTQSETICCAVTYEWTSGKIQPTETNYFSSCHTSATAFI